VSVQRSVHLRAKERALFVLLLINHDRVISVSRLIEDLWPESTPDTAQNLVQQYVSRIRRHLALAGDDRGPGRIETQDPGYVLHLAAGELDADRFEAALGVARRHIVDDDAETAARVLDDALGLWRGAALLDVPQTPTVIAVAARLEERRLEAVELAMETGLALGRHTLLVGELTGLVSRYPYSERLRGHLMVALYRCGRRADALETYRRTRRLMINELGVEPGEDLQRLEGEVLNEAGTLDSPGRSVRHESRAVPTPTWSALPPDISDFTGRAKAVASACDMLTDDKFGSGGPAPPVLKIVGKPGVGKTALAVHVAHVLSDRFPDGQLFVDLRAEASVPLRPDTVLARFLGALGVSRVDLPLVTEERSGVLRQRLAGRRVLMLFDNVASESQIRPILPGSSACAVIVTSRRSLPGIEGATHLILDDFDPDESIDLLARLTGPERVAAEFPAAEQIGRLCAHLPLAVRIAGARLAVQPSWSLARLADRLAEESRLDQLSAGDLGVRSSIATSYDGLERRTDRVALRRLSLLESPDFAPWMCASMIDSPVSVAEQVLDRLAECNLLETVPSGGDVRYLIHDLLRAFGRERAAAEESAEARYAAVVRVLELWLGLIEGAGALLPVATPMLDGFRPSFPPIMPQLARDDPLAWFETERLGLLSAVEQAVALGRAEIAWRLAIGMVPFLALLGYDEDWQRTHAVALTEARRTHDPHGEATLLLGLGELKMQQDRHDAALPLLESARALFVNADNLHGEGQALWRLGVLHRVRGRHQQAREVLDRSMERFTTAQGVSGQCVVMYEMALLAYDQYRQDEASGLLDRTLAMAREAGLRRQEGLALRAYGILQVAEGDLPGAATHLDAAFEIFNEVGDKLHQARVERLRAHIRLSQDRFGTLREILEHCLSVFRRFGDRHGQAHVLDDLGELHRRNGNLTNAATYLREAAGLWESLRQPTARLRTQAMLATLGRTP
jgi:DNA-binding SARP family transcriptional activator/tetratricopeptide (TPR) repeat protein